MSMNRSNPGSLIAGAALIAVGLLALAGQLFRGFNFWGTIWPLFIIAVGLFMVLRSRSASSRSSRRWRDFETQTALTANEDVLECVTIFGGVKKNIISKEFKGGEAITVFGGTELNLLQADTKDRIILELVQVFGGTKLLVPPHWKIHTEEMVTIFGGLNDKRPMPAQGNSEDSKILVIKGTCLFGGIDIKSF